MLALIVFAAIATGATPPSHPLGAPSCVRTSTAALDAPAAPSHAIQQTHVILDQQLKVCRIVHIGDVSAKAG